MKTSPGNGTFDARNFGPACLQDVRLSPTFQNYVDPYLGLFKNGSHGIFSNMQSEDCLTINIFRPSGLADNTSLPVLFWTYVVALFLMHIVASRSVLRYGGSFVAGSGLLYNGSSIVAQSVARVRVYLSIIRLIIPLRNIVGNSGYLRQFQLPPGASWVPARRGR